LFHCFYWKKKIVLLCTLINLNYLERVVSSFAFGSCFLLLLLHCS
jgi:hypothetical protein